MSAAARYRPDFWWGTAASSTQAEGAAPRSDWARWEKAGRAPASRDGNGFATNYRDDFALLADHGLTHHRLSLEWARLEPEPGQHDRSAVEHYRSMLEAAADAGISTWVCLHHFSLPGWFSDDLGGFVDDKARRYHWPRHVDWVAETFGDLVFGWKPINEPVAYASLGWLDGTFPPGRRDLEKFTEALRAVHLANHEAWMQLKGGDQPVATVHNLAPVVPRSTEPHVVALAEQIDSALWGWTSALRDGLLRIPGRAQEEVPDMAGSFDLIGFSYYSAYGIADDPDAPFVPYPADARVGPLGYAPWSEGLGIVLRRLADELPGRPLLIAEHGVGTTDDDWRVDILRSSLAEVESALADGVDVRGFFHWTGIDNYEWLHGFDVPFGLFDRDRKPRPSAFLAAEHAARDPRPSPSSG